MDVTTEPVHHFNSPRHRAAANFLQRVISTGKLGAGPAEPNPSFSNGAFSVLYTFPWRLMTAQLVWSSVVVVISYFVAKRTTPQTSHDALTKDFWESRIVVNPAVAYTLGWAVFVLLGLFISESSNRFNTARVSIFTIGSQLIFLLRKIRHCYPAGTWHPGDLERIAAHLTAYPIALKMTLRGDRSPEQLYPILHKDDVNDVVHADIMHAHCLRVVRAYITVAEDDGVEFHLSDTSSTPPGVVIRRVITKFTDDIDSTASLATRVAEFRPSLAYLNHLRILLATWFMFLPFTLVSSSGWYVQKAQSKKLPLPLSSQKQVPS